MASERQHDLLVVGGGVIGLSIAWRAAQAGLAVAVITGLPAKPGKATDAAAGMLAPISETKPTEEAILRLGLDSAQRWPGFAQELEAASGLDLGYRTEGTLAVALDTGDRAELERLAAILDRFGVSAELVSSREARALEPLLAPTTRGGLLIPSDHSVDPRLLTTALVVAAERETVTLIADDVAELTDDGVITRLAGHEIRAQTTVLAAGWWSQQLAARSGFDLGVRPVKGQALRLRANARLLPSRTIRGIVSGSSIYLVPRADGEVVVGATQEELGPDTTVTAGAVWELLRDARALLPSVTEMELAEVSVGLRPMTADSSPVIRELRRGLVAATGHGRNGVLLAPLTADRLVQQLVGVSA